jgi:hypothetical protein
MTMVSIYKSSRLRIERLVNAMLFENVCRDERQLVNWFSEFRGHVFCSVGYEADSVYGRRNLPHDRTNRISEMRWPISADTVEKFEDWGSLWSSRCYRDGGAWEQAVLAESRADGKVAALRYRQGDFSGLPLGDPVNGCIFRHIRHN